MDLELKQPTEADIKAIELNQQTCRIHVLYHYRCKDCSRLFISNLCPDDVICPYSPMLHVRSRGFSELLDIEVKEEGGFKTRSFYR